MAIGMEDLIKQLRGAENMTGDLYLANLPEVFFHELERFLWKKIQAFPYHERVMEEVEPAPFLFYSTRGKIYTAHYDYDGYDHSFTMENPLEQLPWDKITHFMAMPRPPKEAEKTLIYHDK